MSIFDPLKRGPFREPAHVWLHEVRSQTGYTYHKTPRYADALAVSVWPSRGLAIYGFEAKIHRGDWLKELDSPEKSAPIQGYCDQWWVVATVGVVKEDEVPKAWGFYEIAGQKAICVRKAPENKKKKKLDLLFVASVLRNVSEGQNAIIQQAKLNAHEEATASCDGDVVASLRVRVAELSSDLNRSDREKSDAKRELAILKQAVRDFERGAGIDEGDIEAGRYLAAGRPSEAYRIGRVLQAKYGTRLLQQLEPVLDSLRSLSALENIHEETGT
jgi:hypothetical protein